MSDWEGFLSGYDRLRKKRRLNHSGPSLIDFWGINKKYFSQKKQIVKQDFFGLIFRNFWTKSYLSEISANTPGIFARFWKIFTEVSKIL